MVENEREPEWVSSLTKVLNYGSGFLLKLDFIEFLEFTAKTAESQDTLESRFCFYFKIYIHT